MKSIISITKVVLLFAAAAVAASLSGCKKPTEGIKIIVNSSSLFPAPTVIKFANADSTSANKLGNFAVSISGPGAKFVQLSSGGVNFQASNGILSLALTKDAHPSATNPISFTVSATLNNFAPILQNITITEDKLSVYNIKALEYAKPAQGTTVLLQTTSLNAGMLTTPYTVTTPKTATMAEQATVTFDSGTQMLDVNGNIINAGGLNLNLVQYGTNTTASLQALPGGTTTSTAVKADGTPINGTVNFVTAGLLQMNLNVGGVAVRKFSKTVGVSIEVNSNLTNFATGKPIKAGDVIPYWSLDEGTGQWKSEGNTTLVVDGKGRLSAPIQISHLSCWSVGWSWGAVGSYPTCGNGLNVTINTSDPNFKGGPYNVSLQTADGTYLGGVQGVTISSGNIVNLASVPDIAQAKIVVSGGIPYISVQSSIFAPCGAGSATINVPVTATTVNVTLDVLGLCNGKDLTVLPSATFELYQQTGSTYTDAGTLQLVNGKGTTGLQVGQKYYLTTAYDGKDYITDPFSVSKTDFTVPSSTLALNAKYDASSNTLIFYGYYPNKL